MGGNWKLNPVTLTEAVNLASEVVKLTKGVSGVDVALFPPAPFVAPVAEKLRGSNVKVSVESLLQLNCKDRYRLYLASLNVYFDMICSWADKTVIMRHLVLSPAR